MSNAPSRSDLQIKDSRNLRSDMKRFVLKRTKDISGNSGTGVVAEGVVFSSGWAAMTWLSHLNTVTVYHSIEVVKRLHGHDGATEVLWIDE